MPSPLVLRRGSKTPLNSEFTPPDSPLLQSSTSGSPVFKRTQSLRDKLRNQSGSPRNNIRPTSLMDPDVQIIVDGGSPLQGSPLNPRRKYRSVHPPFLGSLDAVLLSPPGINDDVFLGVDKTRSLPATPDQRSPSSPNIFSKFNSGSDRPRSGSWGSKLFRPKMRSPETRRRSALSNNPIYKLSKLKRVKYEGMVLDDNACCNVVVSEDITEDAEFEVR